MEKPLTDSIKQTLINELNNKSFVQTSLTRLLKKSIYYEYSLSNLTFQWIPIPECSKDKMIRMAKRLMSLIQTYKITFPIHIWFLPLKLKRVFPKKNELIAEQHINGGYTYLSNHTIYVYRLEEFSKVLIHELLHNTYLQTQWSSNDLKPFYTLLNLSERFILVPAEAIVEFWAMYHQLKFIEIELGIPFENLYQDELQWSLSQTKRLLNYRKKYIPQWMEQTNALSYIYFKTCLWYFIHDFMKLKKPYSIQVLSTFLQKRLMEPSFMKDIQKAPSLTTRSFRMTKHGDL